MSETTSPLDSSHSATTVRREPTGMLSSSGVSRTLRILTTSRAIDSLFNLPSNVSADSFVVPGANVLTMLRSASTHATLVSSDTQRYGVGRIRRPSRSKNFRVGRNETPTPLNPWLSPTSIDFGTPVGSGGGGGGVPVPTPAPPHKPWR